MLADELEAFLWFMHERQEIYRRRFIEEEPPPWTEDSVLSTYHFCNVYRELDAGTKYLIENIIGAGPPRDVIFNVYLYRLLNRPESYDAAGGFTRVDEFDADDTIQRLREYRENGNPVFSSAYRIPAHKFAESESKIVNVLKGIIEADVQNSIDDYADRIENANSLEAVHEICCEVRGIGDFIGYEIVTDLNYGFLPFHENDFVNIGPGAESGLKYIFGDASKDHIYSLVAQQDDLFEACDIDFFYWNGEYEKRLTLRSIEHSLCEYAKYVRAQEMDNPHLRHYEPGSQTSVNDFLY